MGNSTCQGNNQDAAVSNIYATSVDTPNPQLWTSYSTGSTTFALRTQGASCPGANQGQCCVDVCANANCGSNQGNIILYGCHYGDNQQWSWEGTADAAGGRMMKSVRGGKCMLACPKASPGGNPCAFAGDVSTTTCDAADPAQRWVYIS